MEILILFFTLCVVGLLVYLIKLEKKILAGTDNLIQAERTNQKDFILRQAANIRSLQDENKALRTKNSKLISECEGHIIELKKRENLNSCLIDEKETLAKELNIIKSAKDCGMDELRNRLFDYIVKRSEKKIKGVKKGADRKKAAILFIDEFYPAVKAILPALFDENKLAAQVDDGIEKAVRRLK